MRRTIMFSGNQLNMEPYSEMFSKWSKGYMEMFSQPFKMNGQTTRPAETVDFIKKFMSQGFVPATNLTESAGEVMKLIKSEQENAANLQKSLYECAQEMSRAAMKGNTEQVWETCLENATNMIDLIETATSERTKNYFHLCKTIIPSNIVKTTEKATKETAKKEKA